MARADSGGFVRVRMVAPRDDCETEGGTDSRSSAPDQSTSKAARGQRPSCETRWPRRAARSSPNCRVISSPAASRTWRG